MNAGQRDEVPGADELVVAIADEIWPTFDPVAAPQEIGGRAVRYVRESEVGPEGGDLVLGAQRPSASGRRQVFQTSSGAVYEQDEDGLLYRDGILVFPGPLLAFAAARSQRPGFVVPGEELLLLFGAPAAGSRLRLRLTTPVLRAVQTPRVAPRGSRPGGPSTGPAGRRST